METEDGQIQSLEGTSDNVFKVQVESGIHDFSSK
jgi:hypothetical protein